MNNTISEHIWVQENIPAYDAGGLESAERDRAEKHIAKCADCRRALEDIRSMDRHLTSLFTDSRPSANLEDRMIQFIRKTRMPYRFRRPHWVVSAAAAVLLLGVTGALADRVLSKVDLQNSPVAMATKLATSLSPEEVERYRSLGRAFGMNTFEGQEKSPLEMKGADRLAKELGDETEKNPAELLNSTGYYPPSRALVVKGSSRIPTNLGESPDGDTDESERLRISGETAGKENKKDPAFSLGLRLQFPGQQLNRFGYINNSSAAKSVEEARAARDEALQRWNMQKKLYAGAGGRGAATSEEELRAAQLTYNRYQYELNRVEGIYRVAPPTIESPKSLAAITPESAISVPALQLGKQSVDKSKDGRLGLEPAQLGKSDSKKIREEDLPRERDGNLAIVGKEVTKEDVLPRQTPEQPAAKPPAEEPPSPTRKIIRTGDIEFEIQSFDSTVAAITKLINGIKGGLIATVNSEKLANGKVRGSIVVRVPPESLDTLILDLRKELGQTGELKGMKIGTQDITKQYTDIESHLRGARAMQERLLAMIKEGKGAIKDLLQAEKELGVWRTRIEELEGEIRYYNNQVALSTLTITLYEKEIRSPYAVTQTERVLMGLEVSDVEKSYQQVLSAVAEAKGRITKSELKQHTPEQYGAVINFEVAPESSGPMRDRMRQIGNVSRLEIDRVQQTEGGTGKPQDGKMKLNDAQFFVSLYNLANFIPRETVTIQVATTDVAAGYQSLRDGIAKIKGRIVNSQFNEQDKQNITAQLDFDFRRTDVPVVDSEIGKVGDIFSRIAARAQDGENVLDSKVRYLVAIVSQSHIPARETLILAIEVNDADASAAAIAQAAARAAGRTIDSRISREQNGRVTAKLVYDVPLAAAAGLAESAKKSGIVRVERSSRNEQVPESALSVAHIDVTLSNKELIVPSDEGIWPQVRRGLSTSVFALSWSLTVVIIGVCFVLPWAVVFYSAYRLVLRFRRRPATPAA
jgi:hypothetical protein